jgi:hypothetical protein
MNGRELLLRHEFSSRAPSSWHALSSPPEYSDGAAVAKKSVRWAVPLPNGAWNDVEIALQISPHETGIIVLGDGATNITIDFTRNTFRALHGQGVLLANGSIDRADADICFRFGTESWSTRLGDKTLFSIAPPHGDAISGLLILELHENLQLRAIEISGVKAGESTPLARSEKFELEVAVDFIDDLLHAPYTDKMFDDLFAELRSWGTSSVQWIYYGRQVEGWWDGCPPQLRGSAHAAQTFQNVGDIFERAVRAAHDHGLQIHALLKPFDNGLFYSTHPDAPNARLKRIGNGITWIPHFVAQRRDLCTTRKPGNFGAASSEPVTQIDLVKADDAPAAFGVEEIQLLVSDDNLSYREYSGPLVREETVEEYSRFAATPSGLRDSGETCRARVLRFSGLKISAPYFAITAPDKLASFSNAMGNLIHVFTASGREKFITYGIEGRLNPVNITGAVPSAGQRDFRKNGVEFDIVPGKSTAVLPGDAGLERAFTLDSGEGFIAIARGKEATPIGVLSPSFPEARDWWMSWLRDALDAGADGTEIRVRNHHSPMTWREFGFEKPVVDAFRERYGVDILAVENFDELAWQKLRGEGFTELIRAASRLTRERGKIVGLHLSPTTITDLKFGPAMNIHWDWKRWLSEKLSDRITLKELMPGTTPVQQIVNAQSAPLPMYYSPYANGLTKPGDEKRIQERIEVARKNGAAGYQLYECAAFIHPTSDGKLQVNEGVRAMLKEQFAEKS